MSIILGIASSHDACLNLAGLARSDIDHIATLYGHFPERYLKRALRRMLGMAEWPEAAQAQAPAPAPQQAQQHAQTKDAKGG